MQKGQMLSTKTLHTYPVLVSFDLTIGKGKHKVLCEECKKRESCTQICYELRKQLPDMNQGIVDIYGGTDDDLHRAFERKGRHGRY